MPWVDIGELDMVELEDVARFDHGGATYCVYRSEDGAVYASDGLCTHEQVHLADGFVMGSIIECPKHNGRFDYRTGEPKGAPVCVALKTYPAKIEGGRILVDLPG